MLDAQFEPRAYLGVQKHRGRRSKIKDGRGSTIFGSDRGGGGVSTIFGAERSKNHFSSTIFGAERSKNSASSCFDFEYVSKNSLYFRFSELEIGSKIAIGPVVRKSITVEILRHIAAVVLSISPLASKTSVFC